MQARWCKRFSSNIYRQEQKKSLQKTSCFPSKQKYEWTNFQPLCNQWEIQPTSVGDIPCLCRFQKGIWLSMAWRPVRYNVPVCIWWHVNHIDMPAIQTNKQTAWWCSKVQWVTGFIQQPESAGLPTVTHSVQYLHRMDKGRSAR